MSNRAARIGLDLRLHAYAPGGISRYARRLARALAELDLPEKLVLISHRKDPDTMELPGARTWKSWTPPHHRAERWLLGTELAPLGLDLLHTTDFIPPAWGTRRRVITVHDLNFLHYPDYLTADARRYYNGQIAWAVHEADAILVDSHATQRDLQALLGVAPERIVVAYLAADEQFRTLPEDEIQPVLSQYGLQAGYLLFVGVWEPRKNLPGLLEALSLLHGRGLMLHLVIAGRPGWLYDEVHARIGALGLAPWVHFVENPGMDELVALYNGALLLAMPSFYEGFGLPALEAMQCGTPAVVADRASLPEVVAGAGLLVHPDDPVSIADACARIAEDPVLHQSLRDAGRARAATFSWRKTAGTTLGVYRAVLSDR